MFKSYIVASFLYNDNEYFYCLEKQSDYRSEACESCGYMDEDCEKISDANLDSRFDDIYYFSNYKLYISYSLHDLIKYSYNRTKSDVYNYFSAFAENYSMTENEIQYLLEFVNT